MWSEIDWDYLLRHQPLSSWYHQQNMIPISLSNWSRDSMWSRIMHIYKKCWKNVLFFKISIAQLLLMIEKYHAHRQNRSELYKYHLYACLTFSFVEKCEGGCKMQLYNSLYVNCYDDLWSLKFNWNYLVKSV